MGERVDSIADHLDLVPLIASWHFAEWGHCDPGGSLASWTAGLSQRTNRNHIPTTFVAFADNQPVGSVTLTDNDMTTHPEWTPWLAGLYVLPHYRRRGIASTLVRHAVQAAAAMKINIVYLHTHTAQYLYTQLGWVAIGQEVYEQQQVTMMYLTLDNKS